MCSSSNDVCLLDLLPLVCVHRLCNFLSEKDVFHCCEVSRRFYALFIDNRPNCSITISISLLPAEEHVDRLFHLIYEHGHTRHRLYAHMRLCKKCRSEVKSVFRLRKKCEISNDNSEFLTDIKKKLEAVRDVSKRKFVEQKKMEIRKDLKPGEMLKGDIEQKINEKATELLRQKVEDKPEPVPTPRPDADKQKAILVRIGGQMRLLTEKDVEENNAFREQADVGWREEPIEWMFGYEMRLEEEICRECAVHKANCIRIDIQYENSSEEIRTERIQYDEAIESRLTLFCRLYNPKKLLVRCLDFSQSYLLPPIAHSFSEVVIEAASQDLTSLQTFYKLSQDTTFKFVTIDPTIIMLSNEIIEDDDDASSTSSDEE
ncbi:hypothetical protein WR25_22269 [Diploscapter pachys]|uniref:F-box domain-containing protein n=1 Tax=Diploscapter pachys TaxID=2018661 RepID=A0A2A2L5V6_9BILA|nr:hypothetical protein WR25_22269 [Diploscapter pachys]